MKFLSFVSDVKGYFEDNIRATLDTLKSSYPTATIGYPKHFIESEYPDTDKYTGYAVYILTPDFEFENLSNESFQGMQTIEVYAVFDGQKIDVIKANAAIYAEAFYSMVKSDPTLGGAVDYSMISKVNFFEGVEGALNKKAIYLEIKALKEV